MSTEPGPEIFEQTQGKIDGFICSVGSGGTLGGVAMALKARNPDIRIGLADPEGAALFSYYTSGELKSSGNSITEGIGQGRITANLADLSGRPRLPIPDSEALPYVFDLLEHEGLCLGGSSGINIAGAVRMARDLGPGKTIVTVLCDYGNRYQSKLFNPAFLQVEGPAGPALAGARGQPRLARRARGRAAHDRARIAALERSSTTTLIITAIALAQLRARRDLRDQRDPALAHVAGIDRLAPVAGRCCRSRRR